MNILDVQARLALDTTTQKSLFTISVENISQFTAKLSSIATGTANFQVFENGVQKIQQDVTADGHISYTPEVPGSKIEFYVNSYNQSDLPTVHTSWS